MKYIVALIMCFIGSAVTYKVSSLYEFSFVITFLGGAITMITVHSIVYWKQLMKE